MGEQRPRRAKDAVAAFGQLWSTGCGGVDADPSDAEDEEDMVTIQSHRRHLRCCMAAKKSSELRQAGCMKLSAVMRG